MKKILSLLSLVFLLQGLAPAQEIENWIATRATIPYEKLYLHVDRELYAPGDCCWFKAYLVDGLTHFPLPGYKNVYVTLLSGGGRVVASRLLLMRDGLAHGEMVLDPSLPDGSYTLRASTKYLENFGEEAVFHRRIYLSGPKSSLELAPIPANGAGVAEVTFYPEGGHLVLNALNHVAVKAIDNKGRGMEVRGTICDENDSVVAHFRTGFLGMGRLLLMPLEGKHYKAKLNGLPEFEYPFDRIRKDGLAFHVEDRDSCVLFSVSRNFLDTRPRTCYLVASHKGIVLFYKQIVLEDLSHFFVVEKNNFPLGISKLTLLDEKLEPEAERLFFICDPEEAPLRIVLNKKEYHTRERVEAGLTVAPDRGDTVMTFLSAAVMNRNYMTSGGIHFNILRYLLLDSELKGPVESSLSYFSTSGEIPPVQKLDLLMMVQGWRSYWWDEVTERRSGDLPGYADAGLTVEGRVQSLLGARPVVGGEVIIGPFSRNLLFEETRTDSLGRFRIDRLYLTDSARIRIQARNEKNRFNTVIIPDTRNLFPDSLPVAAIRNILPDMDIPLQFYRDNYYRQLTQAEFDPGKNNILLEEMVVYGRYREKEEGSYRMYGEPDRVLKITGDDYTYSGILEYLTGKVAGLNITDEGISIRGGGMPLFLLDGIRVDPDMVETMIFNISMPDIDKIEIMKSGFAMAAFGSQGGNGVIAVYTKRGGTEEETPVFTKGQLILQLSGFRTPARFYAPRYILGNIDDPRPDYRPTLFWKPDLRTGSGKAAIEFWTSDEVADYYLIAEGINSKGKICFAVEPFRVTERFSPTE